MIDNGIFTLTRGDQQRLPPSDGSPEYLQLKAPDTGKILDLTGRTVELALVTKRVNGERIDLTNTVEIGDPTAGEVAITLAENDTSVPIDGGRTTLYGEFRVLGGETDPTTGGTIKITVYPSRHAVEGKAALLPYIGTLSGFANESGVIDAEGSSIEGARAVQTDRLSNNPVKDTEASVSSLLSQGYPVAQSDAGLIASVDWNEFATDNEAIQDLNTWLISQTVPSGRLTIPSITSNGDPLHIEDTVVIGDATNNTANIDAYIIGNGRQHAEITTTISDGRPLFKMQGETTTGSEGAGRGRKFICNAAVDIDHKDAPLLELEHQTLFTVFVRFLQRYTGAGIIYDGVANGTLLGMFSPKSDTAVVIESRNDQDFNINSDTFILPGTVVRGGYDSVFDDTASPLQRLIVGGYYEGCTGTATFRTQNKSRLLLTPYATLGNTKNGANAIQIDDIFAANISPSRVVNIDGDGIVTSGALSDGNYVNISNDVWLESIGGEYINIHPDDTNANIRVPREMHVTGSVSYPPGVWTRMRYHDGWQKHQGGTTTITAGDSGVVLSAFGGTQGRDMRIIWSAGTAPDAALEPDIRQQWNTTNNQWEWVVDEVSGETTGSFDMDWQLERM